MAANTKAFEDRLQTEHVLDIDGNLIMLHPATVVAIAKLAHKLIPCPTCEQRQALAKQQFDRDQVHVKNAGNYYENFP